MAQLVGVFRIGRDAEVRYTPSGDAVVSLSLAFNFYDKAAENNRGSQWIEAAMFGKRAESLAPYLLKGSQIYAVMNDPHIETYQKKDNTSGVKLTGKIGEVELIGKKDSNGASNAGGDEPQQQRQPRQQAAAKPSFGDLDDDVPF